MIPTLISIGAFNLQTISVFEALAFFAAALVFWRRAKEESYLEAKVFDGFLLSFIVGWLSGRAGYVLFNWSQFGIDVLKWLNVVHYPGNHLFSFLIGATVYLYFYAKKQKWDEFEILDWWSQSLSTGLLWLSIGSFLAGIGFGHATNLPWGIVFPGVFEPRHPVQIYFVIFYLAMFKLLDWLEFNYRSFEWYRSGKKTAQTGFLFITFVTSYALFALLAGLVQPAQLTIGTLVLDELVYLLVLFFGLYLLLLRANRSFFSLQEKKFFAIKK
jgi:phosphatidylglycerol:prolipoprotein diacylglycerol transferase